MTEPLTKPEAEAKAVARRAASLAMRAREAKWSVPMPEEERMAKSAIEKRLQVDAPRETWWQRNRALVLAALLAAIAVGAALWLGGCSQPEESSVNVAPIPEAPAEPPTEPAPVPLDDPNTALNELASAMQYGAYALIAAAIAGAIALFWLGRTLIPLWVGTCIGCAFTLGIASYSLLRWGPLIAVLCMIVGGLLLVGAAIPLLVPWYRAKWRAMLGAKGEELLGTGHVPEAVAFMATAQGIDKDPTARKSLLQRLQAAAVSVQEAV